MTPIKAFVAAENAKAERKISPEDLAKMFNKCPNTIYKMLKKSVENLQAGHPEPNDFPCGQMVPGGSYTIYETRAVEWGKRNGLI